MASEKQKLLYVLWHKHVRLAWVVMPAPDVEELQGWQ